jgi:hypothetical protein
MIMCQFDESGVCTACGYAESAPGFVRNCCGAPGCLEQRRGLGDMVSDFLSVFGITKRRVNSAAIAVGVSDCGCAARQQAMNEWGKKNLGIG